MASFSQGGYVIYFTKSVDRNALTLLELKDNFIFNIDVSLIINLILFVILMLNVRSHISYFTNILILYKIR